MTLQRRAEFIAVTFISTTIDINHLFYISYVDMVHHCGIAGRVTNLHAGGLDSIPGWVRNFNSHLGSGMGFTYKERTPNMKLGFE